MTTLADHLSDDNLSGLLDARLAPDEERAARAHLDACPTCSQRLAELRALVSLLRRLPELEPPRDFTLGPRLVAEPSNVIRLERWYTWTRAAAASLAAVFVFLVGGTVLVDQTQPVTQPTAFQSRPSAELAARVPTAAVADQPPAAPPAPAPAAAKPPAAAPAAARQAAEAPAAGVAANVPQLAVSREQPAQADATDQVKAATSVSALVTPTAEPVARPRAEEPFDAFQASDTAAPFRTAASVIGVLAALAVLGALVVRHRLRAARSHLTRTQEP